MNQPNTDRMPLVVVRRWLDPERIVAEPAYEYPALAAAGVRLLYPFTGNHYLTQGYHAKHPGIDWGMPSYTPLRASHDGQVVRAGWDYSGYGYMVAIKSDALGLYSIYAHMPNISQGIRVGMWVKAGERIGASDNTGNSTGPHLHFETRRPPYRYGLDGFDPRPFLVRDDAPPPAPPPAPGERAYEVIKPAGKLAVHVVPSKGGQIVRYYKRGKVIEAADVIDAGADDWVRTKDGYCLKQTNGKRYLREV